MDETAFRLLTEMRQRLRSNPEYLANLFGVYQQQTELDDEGLAEELQVGRENLIRLALCRCPDTNSDAFVAQVKQLASYAGVETTILLRVIQQARLLQKEARPRGKPIAVGELVSRSSSQSAFRDFAAAFSGHATPILVSALILATVTAGVFYLYREIVAPQKVSDVKAQSVPDSNTESFEQPQERPSGGNLIAKATTEKFPGAESTGKLSSKHATKRASQELRVIASVRIDLDEYQTLREAQTEEERKRAIKLPKSRTRISFKLPEGSANGTYFVQVVDAFNKPLVTSKAKSANGKMLTVTLDARSLEEKPYRLCISRKGEAPGYYLVIVEKEKNSK
jgi:hypothetical protein